MSPLDVLVGFPYGTVTPPRRFRRSPTDSPRSAIERIVLDALERRPCVVGFSGGRDSSTVLAIAMHVARREGLPEPIPVTRVYPEAPQTDETEWQELVIRHLGVTEWVREPITDSMDVVGPMAAPRLLAHGVLWSPLLHGDDFFVRHARGGTVLDGEGGDEICDPAIHRITPLARMIRQRRRPSRQRLRVAASVVAPGRIRPRRTARQLNRDLRPWLRPAAYQQLEECWRPHVDVEPLDSRRSIMLLLSRRANVDLQRNRAHFAALSDTRVVSPLLEPSVARAIATRAGRLGYRDRAECLTELCGDLLPRAVLERWTKAEFNATFFNRYTREFAAAWTGEGVDHELVDAEILRDLWLGQDHKALSACLLQSAWLTTTSGD